LDIQTLSIYPWQNDVLLLLPASKGAPVRDKRSEARLVYIAGLWYLIDQRNSEVKVKNEGLNPSTGTQRRSLPNALIWILPCAGLLLALSLIPYQVDDAYISYRYAQNFAAGEGLVYNPGEAASEGFTSPLWFLLLSLGAGLLRMEFLPFFSTALGLLAYLGLLLVLARSSRAEPQVMRLLGMLALALWPGLVFYASTGMETLFFVLCVAIFQCAALKLLSRKLGLAAAFLSIWIRPEGGWLVAALLLSFLPFGELRRQLFSKRIVWQVTALIAGGALLTGLRWLLFADLLPNTFYAKLPDYAAGLSYLKSFILSWPGGLLITLALLGALWGELRHRSFFLAGLAWMAAPVLEGGDWMPHHRFLLPAVVFLVLAALGTAHARQKNLRRGVGILALVLAGLLGWQDLAIVRQAQYSYDKLVRREMAIAKWARENDVASLASVDIGVLGYYSGAKIVDVVGLTDRRIARSTGGHLAKQFDLDHVFVKGKPACLILRSSIRPVIENGRLTRCRPGSEIERRLFFDRRLLTDYRLAMSMEVENAPRQSKLLFLRRDQPLARRLAAVSRIVF
jgi:arabinofuranosyltransferase